MQSLYLWLDSELFIKLNKASLTFPKHFSPMVSIHCGGCEALESRGT